MLTFIANCCKILLEMLTVNMTNIVKMYCINTPKWRIDDNMPLFFAMMKILN